MKTPFAFLPVLALCFSVLMAEAQTDSLSTISAPHLQWKAFADVFFGYDFNQPRGDKRQAFFYNHNRHQEINLNFGFIKLAVEQPTYRANLAFHAGTYVNDNYADEPGVLKNIFEANAGFTFNRRRNLWLDAGIFASHIGFESAVSMENWTLSRSILAENSPYYLSGAKLTYTPNEKWEWLLLVCNGWQHIQRVNGSTLPSFGSQVKWTPNDKLSFNWSTFIGTNDPDSTRRMRYFNNFYGQIQLTKRVGWMVGFDVGAQQSEKKSSVYHIWFSPVAIARITLNEKWAASFRGEYYQDSHSVMISTPQSGGFQTSGYSANLDYSPDPKILARIEGRFLYSSKKIFERNQIPVNDNLSILTSIAVRF